MRNVDLAAIKTADGITLEGMVIHPFGRKQAALVWLHGLSSRFSSGLTLARVLSLSCRRFGIGYFKFNTRGHDIVWRAGKKIFGGGFEGFEDCVLDIRAMVRCARRFGYRRIILVGHSTGANKAAYYLYKTRDRAVKGLILLAPISDVSAGRKLFGKKKLSAGIRIARRLSAKSSFSLMPSSFGLMSGRRFLSLNRPGEREDVFPYHTASARWRALESIRSPLAVVFGSRDEFLDRPARELVKVFKENARSTKSFSGYIIEGGRHGFRKKESELARVITGWMRRAIV